ncbi:MAG: hypothetical protein JWN86_1356 [Planctomycetota bacterium]|nr:hypothetical protein [Planctomycetota bacterium]
MSSIRPKWRFPSIALVTVLGSLFMAGRATACETMKADSGCATVKPCGCCKPSATVTPAHEVANSITASRSGPIRGTTACETSPTVGCVCGTERPAAPEPRPGPKSSDNRSAPARDLGLFLSDLLPSLVPPDRSTTPAVGHPWRTPLYLRTSRLLI